MFRVFLALVFAFTMTTASARTKGEHLEPEQSVFTGNWAFDYYKSVLRVLGEPPLGETGVWPGGRIAAFVFPSFSPEYRIAVTLEDGNYAVSHVQPEIQIWGFLRTKDQKAHLEANPQNPSPEALSDEDWAQWKKDFAERESKLPDNVEDIELETCVRKINQTLAKKIFGVWESTLKQTRYADDDHPRGVDGVTYHFTMHSKRHIGGMAGKIWLPPRSTNPGRLAAISETMRRYCLDGGGSVLRELEQQVADLTVRLGEEQSR